MSDSVRPHRRQPTRLPRPWVSPGKNTGVGCHFLLQCMKVKSESEVAQLCPTLSDPVDCSLPGSSIHGIFQARVLEWGAFAFSNANPRKNQIWKQTITMSLIHVPIDMILSIYNQEAQRNAVCPEQCLSAFSNLMKSVFLSSIKMNLLSFHFFIRSLPKR